VTFLEFLPNLIPSSGSSPITHKTHSCKEVGCRFKDVGTRLGPASFLMTIMCPTMVGRRADRANTVIRGWGDRIYTLPPCLPEPLTVLSWSKSSMHQQASCLPAAHRWRPCKKGTHAQTCFPPTHVPLGVHVYRRPYPPAFMSH
jgi:hypothetical protein